MYVCVCNKLTMYIDFQGPIDFRTTEYYLSSWLSKLT